MSAINLLLLGLLLERPLSAYDLDKWVAQCNLNEMIQISSPAIYKNLVKLRERGALEVMPSPEGGGAEKTVYSVTEEGRRQFFALLEAEAARPLKTHFAFNAVVMNLDKVRPGRGLEIIDGLRRQLERRAESIRAQEEAYRFLPLEGRTIIAQLRLVNEALLKWSGEFRAQYEQKSVAEGKAE